METADGGARLGSFLRSGRKGSTRLRLERRSIFPSFERTDACASPWGVGWGGVGREREWMGREEGGEGRGRRRGGGQTRDLVTGVIVNGVNCHLARIGPRNVFMNHDRQAGELSVYEHLNLPPLVKGEIQSKNRGGVV